MKHPILKWVDKRQRREIMKKHGLKSDQQIHNIINDGIKGEPTSFSVLQDIVTTAEQNKLLYERIKKLEA